MAGYAGTQLHDVTAHVTPAPGRLEVIRRFLNTVDFEHEDDLFETGAGARRWLVKQGLLRRGVDVGDGEAVRLVDLREAMRSVAESHNGAALRADAVARLKQEAAAATISAVLENGDSMRLVGGNDSVDAVVSALVAIVCEAVADDTWSRLKACRSGTCRWAFYDASRNRAGTWCSMEVCGNRAKVRSYRTRHR